MIELAHFQVLSAALFAIGLYGVLARRSAVLILMSIELMLNAVNINLIGFNPFAEAPYKKPSLKSMIAFRDNLRSNFPGEVTLRRSRGEDIQGACGQLSLKNKAPR